MKNQKKLIVIATIIALLICAALMSCAMADERIYTSPTFKLPAEKIQEWTESQPEEEVPAEEQPTEGTPEEGEPEDEWLDDDPRGDEEDGEPTAETPAEGTEGETPAAGTEPQGEEGEVVGETETKAPERTVTIRSSQGDVVTEGEIIYLTSKLKGFDGLDIAYQWQVDRGDGAGWVDVEGANRSKHMFVADKETITYSWRLIVTVMDEE